MCRIMHPQSLAKPMGGTSWGALLNEALHIPLDALADGGHKQLVYYSKQLIYGQTMYFLQASKQASKQAAIEVQMCTSNAQSVSHVCTPCPWLFKEDSLAI